MKITKVNFRRRREYKTDYASRIRLLKSRKSRLIIRKTNKYIIAQIVKSEEAKDTTVAFAVSKELTKYGWNYSFKSLPAAYLTGLLIASKVEGKTKEAIFDIGLQRSTKGSRLYAVVKGAIDGGLKIACDEEMLPSEKRLKGEHLKTKDIDEKIEDIKNKILK